jgi:tRNA(fMet)-specific endonuclease VapC
MNGSLLDSNIIIDFFRNKNGIADEIFQIESIYVPVVVVGELYYGAYLSDKSENQITLIENFFNKVTVLQIDEETAKIYSKLKFQLKQKGTPIPENDIWIAALSKQYNIQLFTNDKHFGKISGLKLKKTNND